MQRKNESSRRVQSRILFLMLLVVVGTQALVPAFSSNSSTLAANAWTGSEKGLQINTDVILNKLTYPSFSELKLAGFTLLGTGVYWDSRPGTPGWSTIVAWIQQARAAGFKTFLGIHTDPKRAIEWTKQAASIGTDVVELDELLARYQANKAALQSIIKAGLAINPNLLFVVTEYMSDDLKNAYAWTSKYPTVRVATDHYNDKGSMDLCIQLAAQYGKSPLAWLIVSQAEMSFDCYNNLNDWIAYANQRNLSVFFWEIDSAGTWQAQWNAVLAY